MRIRLWCLLALTASGVAGEICPFPRAVISDEKLLEWNFASDTQGWVAQHDCSVAATNGVLLIKSTGLDPFLASPVFRVEGSVLATLRMRCATDGGGQLFWITEQSPQWGDRQSVRFDLVHDNKWREYTVELPAAGTLKQLRLDPGMAPGKIEVAWIRLNRVRLHPLEIESVAVNGREVTAQLWNHAVESFECTVGAQSLTIAGGGKMPVKLAARGEKMFEAFPFNVQAKGLPAIHRTAFLFHPDTHVEFATRDAGKLRLRVATDGSGALLERDSKVVAILAPLVARGGVVPKLKLSKGNGPLRLRGDGVAVTLTLTDSEVLISIESETQVEGPVVRAMGGLEQGLFAGLEYLGRGEASSSTLDIETPEHVRFAPDLRKVTMPLMACVTDKASVAMTWKDMTLQPVFATPNFFDGTSDHRMALRGKKIEATIRVTPPAAIENAILWATKKIGLPPLPQPPRDRDAQRKLCLAALNGPLKTEKGWGHCAEPSWVRQPFADMASTIWRLTGEAPELPTLVPHGSHIRNDAIYFVTGRGKEWLTMRADQARKIIGEQKADGSFRYDGKFRRGHFEDTASGLCGAKAEVLLEFAWLTGNKEALDAGVKALEFVKQFRTPRGAQTWEVALHTPDILASAHLVTAYVRGFELTGEKSYLAEARRWALSGVPFVYLWGDQPIMAYSTIAVYGATNWQAPNWMGLPVQWCGYDYAYALTKLAPHDSTLDWTKLAHGILIAAEQMQYPDGQFVGCEPDSFSLATQTRNESAINPCAIVSLRLVLDGELDALAVATDGKHRVVAPFPMTIRDGKAHVQAKKGVKYQVLVDGERVVDVDSQGEDVVPLKS